MIAPNAQERLTQIVEPLLFWYQKNKRSLPWRDQPTPYRVWVSEIMLQQTRVEAVKPYFERFLSQLPSIQALASCPEDRLLKLWEGLGYYSRARNLQKAARLLVEQYGGQLPADYRQLLLPVVPQHSAGDFNQALMELGATVCLPSSARCLLCPLAALCRAHQEGCTQQYPVKAPKKARQIQQRTLFAILCRTAEGTFTLLHRRPDSGLLAGLWEIPSVEGALTEEQAQQAAAQLLEPFGLSVLSVQPQKPARHIFTHIEWQMSCLLVKTGDNTLSRSQIDRLLPEDFLLTDRLDSVSLPSAFQSYTSLLTTLIGSY